MTSSHQHHPHPHPHPPRGSSAASSHGSDLFSFMPMLGILILTVTSVFSAIRARHDVPTVAFIISMYVFLMLLFYCLHVHDTQPENSQKKEKMRVPIWFLATILNLLFAYRVSTMLPLSLDCLVWAMAGSTSLLGFYVFFIYKEDKSKSLAAANTKTDSMVKSVDSEPFVAAAEKV